MRNFTLAIYFSEDGAYSAPFNSLTHLNNYIYLIETLRANNIKVVIVRGNSYLSNGYFSNFYIVNSPTSITHNNALVKVDLILNRDQGNTIPYIYDCPIINDMDFDILCTNKYQTYLKLTNYHPETFIVHSYEQFNAIKLGDKVVVKPNDGNCGEGVIIDSVANIKESDIKSWNNYVVQEFMDTSVGIDGIVDGVHDLRIIMIGNDPIMSILRTPKDGSLIANIAMGGTGSEVALSELPKEVFELIESINNDLKTLNPFFWSIDLANSASGFRVIELNSHPGISSEKLTKKLTVALLQEILESRI